MTEPVALLVHAHPSVVPAYVDALGVEVFRISSKKSQLSAGYDSRSGIAATVKSVPAALDAYTKVRPETPVVLVGFSAGCWAVRAWLRHEASRAQTIGAIFVDGLHAGGSDKVARLGYAHEGVLAFGRMALAMPDKHCLIITHSDIVPAGYASTRRTAEAVAKALGLPSRSDFDASIHNRGVHIIGDEPDVDGDEGGTARAHSVEQLGVGPTVAGKYVQPLVEAYADTAPPPAPWKNPYKTLGERCVLLSEAEMAAENPPSRATVAKYFSVAVRNGRPLGITRGNHCAAALSWVALRCQLDNETIPHRPRAGAKEVMADAVVSHTWHKAAEVRAGRWRPQIGDLAVYDRSQPGRPESAWWGHVNRVTAVAADGFDNLGANQGARGAWKRGFTAWDDKRWLGFVGYPQQLERPPLDELSPKEVKDILAVRDATISQVLAEAPWEN